MHDILSKSEKPFRHCCLSRLITAFTCVGSPGSPPEVAASDASDLIPEYKPPFLERTLVCIEPQNLEDDDHDDVYYTISARDSNVDDDVR